MELLFIVPGMFCMTGVVFIIAAAALVIARRAMTLAATQASPDASVRPALEGTIAIGGLLGWLKPTVGGQDVGVVEGTALGRQHLNPDDDAITRGDHVVFCKVVASAGTFVVAEILHANGIEVGGVHHTSGRAQIADGATVKIGTTEFTFRKA